MDKIAVRISSSHTVFIEAGADSFGQIFANASDEEQIHILRSMVEHMKPHPMQWDYISIALEKEENRDVRDGLIAMFPPLADEAAKLAKLDSLQAVIADLQRQSEDSYGQALDQFSKPECRGWVAKAHAGAFGNPEYEGHKKANELVGRHLGLALAVETIRNVLRGA